MSDGDDKMCKAERLVVAAAVAPTLRKSTERTRSRRVARLDKDGNVIGYTTLAETWCLARGRAVGGERRGMGVAWMCSEGHPDLVVAFAGEKGTADMVRRAKKAGLEVREIR